MTISINNWRLAPSLNGLIHVETDKIQLLGEFHYILLEVLVKHAGELLSRSFLINEVWKNRVVGNNSLPTAICALRVALGDNGKKQEIIKTIPKKGYQLNKEFIVELDAPLQVSETQPEPTIEWRNLKVECFRLRRKSVGEWFVLLGLLIIAAAFFTHGWYHARSAGTASDLVLNEIQSPVMLQAIKINHLKHKTIGQKELRLSSNDSELLKSLDALLTARKATLTIYYYTALYNLSIDLLVKNQCQTEYQLIMNVRNWKSDSDIVKLDTLLNQEVERTLNEMPDCH